MSKVEKSGPFTFLWEIKTNLITKRSRKNLGTASFRKVPVTQENIHIKEKEKRKLIGLHSVKKYNNHTFFLTSVILPVPARSLWRCQASLSNTFPSCTSRIIAKALDIRKRYFVRQRCYRLVGRGSFRRNTDTRPTQDALAGSIWLDKPHLWKLEGYF